MRTTLLNDELNDDDDDDADDVCVCVGGAGSGSILSERKTPHISFSLKVEHA